MSSSAGERIKMARKRRGFTQQELAAEVGCSQQTVVDIEKQERPRSGHLVDIIMALGETNEWLIGGVGGPVSVESDGDRLPHFDLQEVASRDLAFAGADRAIDYLFRPPVPMSRMAFTVDAPIDDLSAWLGADSGDVFFVDPVVEVDEDALVLVALPGDDGLLVGCRSVFWKDGGFLLASGRSDHGLRSVISVAPYRDRSEFDSHSDPEVMPALIAGVVVFIGRSVSS